MKTTGRAFEQLVKLILIVLCVGCIFSYHIIGSTHTKGRNKKLD